MTTADAGAVEPAAPAAHRDPLAFRTQCHARLFRERFEDIQELASRDGDVTGLLNAYLPRGDEFDLEVGPRDAQTILPR